MSGGGGKSEKVEQSSRPWDAQVPLWKKSFQQLNRLHDSGGLRINPYPGRTVAALPPNLRRAWSLAGAAARKGAPLAHQSEKYVADVLGGKYLGAEAPGLQSVLAKARDSVNANYALGGRYGSGAHDGAVSQATGGILYDNYARERAIQDGAVNLAGDLADQRYRDAQALAEAGAQQRQYRQDLIDARINRHNALQQAGINELALYQQLIGGNLGGKTSTTQPSSGQPLWLQTMGALTNLIDVL